MRRMALLAFLTLSQGEVQEWTKQLKSEKSEVRRRAVDSLRKAGAREAAGEVVRLLHDADGGVRREAVKALHEWKSPEVLPQVVEVLKDRESRARDAASEVLRRMEAGEVIPLLAPLLRDGREDVRDSAFGTLVGLKSREAIVPLLEAAGAAQADVRKEAARALGEMGFKEGGVIEALLDRLEDEDDEVREEASGALVQLDAGDPDTAARIVGLLQHKNGGVRGRAAMLLGELGAREGLSGIAGLLRDKDPEARKGALEALAWFRRVPDVAPGVCDLLKDGDSGIRKRACSLIGKWGVKEAASQVLDLLKDSKVRQSALLCLVLLGRREEIAGHVREGRFDPIREASQHRIPFSAFNALARPEIWGRLRDTSAEGALEGAAQDLWRAIGRRAEIRVLAPEGGSPEAKECMNRRIRIRRQEASLLDLLGETLHGRPYDFVLEGDDLRILPRDQAKRFWEKWWAEAGRR